LARRGRNGAVRHPLSVAALKQLITHLRPQVLELQRRARLEPVVAQLAAVLERLAALVAVARRQREALPSRVVLRFCLGKLGFQLVDGRLLIVCWRGGVGVGGGVGGKRGGRGGVE
jgi:hypothetical protein